jgi:uncharacterized protein YabE (DUF348 family)
VLRSIKYGLHGAIVAGLIAVPAVWSSVDKSVHLDVDGRSVAVRTTADTVGQVLKDRGYSVDSHDLLAPSTGTHIKDGSRIVLRHGRLLHLSIDGSRKNVWTTAPTVATALAALGYGDSDFVSVSRSRRLPLAPTSLAIRTPQVVTVVHDGQRQAVTTTDATVGQLLDDLDLTLGSMDRLSATKSAAIRPGSVITLERVRRELTTRTESVPFATTKKKDSSMTSGTTKVVTQGKDGQARITYAEVFVDGKAVGRTKLNTVTVHGPQTQVIKVGTRKVVPANTPDAGVPDPGSAKAIAKTLAAARGWGDDQYSCLVAMWSRESGWRVNAANSSGAYGIPQALPGSKMASAGPNWQSDAATQIKWGLGYIADRYSTPCGAWSFWQAHNYY